VGPGPQFDEQDPQDIAEKDEVQNHGRTHWDDEHYSVWTLADPAPAHTHTHTHKGT
jgi:hypothetical protein